MQPESRVERPTPVRLNLDGLSDEQRSPEATPEGSPRRSPGTSVSDQPPPRPYIEDAAQRNPQEYDIGSETVELRDAMTVMAQTVTQMADKLGEKNHQGAFRLERAKPEVTCSSPEKMLEETKKMLADKDESHKAELEKKDDEHQAETKRLLKEKDEENEGMRAELARLRAQIAPAEGVPEV